MKMKLKISCLFGMVVMMTGCASIHDSPYHKMWHNPDYAAQDSNGLSIDNFYGIPVAEGTNMRTGVNTLVTQPLLEEGAYALESDPFRSYVTPLTPLTGQRAGQTSINGSFFSHY